MRALGQHIVSSDRTNATPPGHDPVQPPTVLSIMVQPLNTDLTLVHELTQPDQVQAHLPNQ